jgi:hypothetical protein
MAISLRRELMAVELERVVLPEYADVKIEVSVSARINVTDVAAQRKVSRLLLDLVGTQLYGEKPSLVAGQRLVWRVPVWLGLPTIGPVEQIATLDVDTQTGEVLYTQQLLNEITERGNEVATLT